MNLDAYLTQERKQLLEERRRIENDRLTEQLSETNNTNAHNITNNNNDKRQASEEVEKSTGTPLPVMAGRTTQAPPIQYSDEMAPTSKDAKERANLHNSRQQNQHQYEPNVNDQWVTDTFFNYFPGFSNAYQKRQHQLRERQRQNQENFLKLVPAAAAAGKENAAAALRRKAAKQSDIEDAKTDTARSYITTASNMSRQALDKAEQQIIVNNPNYVSPRQVTRPGSTRHKLLQDLQHTELSQIVSGDGIGERNRRSVELETARKQDYQRELMEQIEEKRRLIELLRVKENQQEEVLTQRLQGQLKTLKLEEQLEQEKVYAAKLQQDRQQNRLLRQQLITKLEQDSAMLQAKAKPVPPISPLQEQPRTQPEEESNRVYRYFSNSARREYRLGQPMPAAVNAELDLDLTSLLSEDEAKQRSCPHCESPLKNYDRCCLGCKKQPLLGAVNQEITYGAEVPIKTRSFSLICEKCQRLYALCHTCLTQNAVCYACQCKRNICLSCRRALCTHCLDNIGKATLPPVAPPNQNAYSAANDGEDEYSSSARSRNLDAVDCSRESPRPPYSMHIERDSIFHPDYDLRPSPVLPFPTPLLSEASEPAVVVVPEHFNIERVRKETDERLSHYFKHYGDLAQLHTRSTQTTPESAGRRDIVLHEPAANLSMPLLREMPKMTRGSVTDQRSKMDTLKRRWDVPAVQKHSISPSNPKVLTQLGAMRKQLQADDFL